MCHYIQYEFVYLINDIITAFTAADYAKQNDRGFYITENIILISYTN